MARKQKRGGNQHWRVVLQLIEVNGPTLEEQPELESHSYPGFLDKKKAEEFFREMNEMISESLTMAKRDHHTNQLQERMSKDHA